MSERRTLMIVHAHPDDEVFSTGGIIARYAAQGDRVVLVYGTRGEAGEMHDPDRTEAEALPILGEIREGEVRTALRLLGTEDLYFLGYRDSGMVDTPENEDPSNFKNAPFDEAVGRLLAIMRETEPQVVVTYDTDGGYGHPDHIQANRVATAAFERAQGEPWGPSKLYYSTRSREDFRGYVEGMAELGLRIPWVKDDFNWDEYGTPNAEITAHIDIAPYAPLKKQALAVHRTQISPDFFYLSVPDEALTRFAGVEYFQRIQPPAQPGEREDDLFAGIAEDEAAA
jgi:N-acetyl-1-D-myo-inositol-2-amino-2-deoxy-alpha-D-glucopyranoside deacetylase